MSLLINLTDQHKSLTYGGFSVPLGPNETKRLRQFRHPTTGDVYDVEHMFATFKERYRTSGILFLEEEELDQISDERLDEMKRDTLLAYGEALQKIVDDLNELNMLQAHEGRPTVPPNRRYREIASRAKMLLGGGERGFVSEQELERVGQNELENAKRRLAQVQALLAGGNVEAAVAVLNAEERTGPSALSPERAAGELVDPLPDPGARKRGAAARDRRAGGEAA